MLIITVISIFARVFEYAILAYCILSWFVRPGQSSPQLVNFFFKLAKLLEPVLSPVRKIMEPITYKIGVDFSPWVCILLVNMAARILTRLLILI